MKYNGKKNLRKAWIASLFVMGAGLTGSAAYDTFVNNSEENGPIVEKVEKCEASNPELNCTLQDYKTAYKEEKFLRNQENHMVIGLLLLAFGVVSVDEFKSRYPKEEKNKKPKKPSV